MSCVNSAHAQHTFVRGCCQSKCCLSLSSYYANPICCGQVQSNVKCPDSSLVICEALASNPIFDNNFPSTDAFHTAMRDTISSLGLTCGTYSIIISHGDDVEGIHIANIVNGEYIVISDFVNGLWILYIVDICGKRLECIQFSTNP